ncbi:ammonium transporter [Pantoea sp. S62]|uniref:ammonium transporter n=1 Tax=Pantoea sp. S62 TaxID=2769342 RepID=UPI001913370F|nr:ammonium transporter [Pantoea sp. S62]
MAWTIIEWRLQKRPGLLNIVSDAIDVMVGVTPACGYIGPVGALCVGILTAALLR